MANLTRYIFAMNSKDLGFDASYRRQYTSQLNSEGVNVSPTLRTSMSYIKQYDYTLKVNPFSCILNTVMA